jgi:hypothetical protein
MLWLTSGGGYRSAYNRFGSFSCMQNCPGGVCFASILLKKSEYRLDPVSLAP